MECGEFLSLRIRAGFKLVRPADTVARDRPTSRLCCLPESPRGQLAFSSWQLEAFGCIQVCGELCAAAVTTGSRKKQAGGTRRSIGRSKRRRSSEGFTSMRIEALPVTAPLSGAAHAPDILGPRLTAADSETTPPLTMPDIPKSAGAAMAKRSPLAGLTRSAVAHSERKRTARDALHGPARPLSADAPPIRTRRRGARAGRRVRISGSGRGPAESRRVAGRGANIRVVVETYQRRRPETNPIGA